MTRIARQVAEDIWNGLVAGLRDPIAWVAVAYAGVLLLAAAGR